MLRTKSHGIVKAGFHSTFTQFVSLGEYAFATRQLCELVQNFARNPQVREEQVPSYDLDKFWQKQEDYHLKLHPQEQQGEISVEEEIDLHREGRMIPIRVSDDERSITLGDYRVDALEFGRMAYYLSIAGCMGWMNGKKPKFAESTIEAIKNSGRELYQEIRKELQVLADP